MAQAANATTTSRDPIVRVGATVPTVQVAHVGLVAKLATLRPHRIVGDADPQDLYERAEYLRRLFDGFFDYVNVIVDDTAACAPLGSIDRKWVAGLLTDTFSDIVGGVAFAAEQMPVEE